MPEFNSTLSPTVRLALDAIERAPNEIASSAIHDYVAVRLPWLSRAIYSIASTWYDLRWLEERGFVRRRAELGGHDRAGRPVILFRVAR